MTTTDAGRASVVVVVGGGGDLKGSGCNDVRVKLGRVNSNSALTIAQRLPITFDIAACQLDKKIKIHIIL